MLAAAAVIGYQFFVIRKRLPIAVVERLGQ
jgi:hypothetical protein